MLTPCWVPQSTPALVSALNLTRSRPKHLQALSMYRVQGGGLTRRRHKNCAMQTFSRQEIDELNVHLANSKGCMFDTKYPEEWKLGDEDGSRVSRLWNLRSSRCEKFTDKAAELARLLQSEVEEFTKSAPAPAPACIICRYFLDRIHLCCDGSQLFGQHGIGRFFYGRAAWTTRKHEACSPCHHNRRVLGQRGRS